MLNFYKILFFLNILHLFHHFEIYCQTVNASISASPNPLPTTSSPSLITSTSSIITNGTNTNSSIVTTFKPTTRRRCRRHPRHRHHPWHYGWHHGWHHGWHPRHHYYDHHRPPYHRSRYHHRHHYDDSYESRDHRKRHDRKEWLPYDDNSIEFSNEKHEKKKFRGKHHFDRNFKVYYIY